MAADGRGETAQARSVRGVDESADRGSAGLQAAPRRFWGRTRLRAEPQGIELACDHCRRPFRVLSVHGRGGQRRRFCQRVCKTAFYAAEQRSSSDDGTSSHDDISADAIEARYQAALAEIRCRRVKEVTW